MKVNNPINAIFFSGKHTPRQMIEYFFEFNVNVKERWFNRNLIDVFSNSFRMYPSSYYEKAIEIGVIRVNNNLVSKNYVLKNSDTIQHFVHRHEPDPIEIDIIAKEDDYIVINKPPGIACHPTGSYNLYSITKILEKHGNLSCINRLDVVTTGVLILAYQNSVKYHSFMMQGLITKIYLAKVRGKFPDQIIVEGKLRREKQFVILSDHGKDSRTSFRLLKYKNGYSLVECQPETGRTHQIRVHLQSLGFPIENDFLYNKRCRDYNSDFLTTYYPEEYECKCALTNNEKYDFAIKNCRGTSTQAFSNTGIFIYLHAYKYKFNDREYTAKMPFWAEKFYE